MNLDTNAQRQVQASIETGEKREEAIALIKSKYLQAAPGHFGEPPESLEEGFPLIEQTNPERGRWIYQQACLHCHGSRLSAPMRESLGMNIESYEYLIEELFTEESLYNYIRRGTHPHDEGFGADASLYMPLYPRERMSDQQVEDLRAFLEEQVRKEEMPHRNE